MTKPRKAARKVGARAAPALDKTRDAARAVFEQIQAAHEKAAKVLLKRGG